MTNDDSRGIEMIPIADLQLDPKNPRFAGELGENPSQPKILDFIADVIGVSDLLSSMSRGGYHSAHPLLGVREGDSLFVVEGNRRLAAALILAEDDRAINQRLRARSYPVTEAAKATLKRLPVLIAADRNEVLPYLGIAHIVGTKKWDSYAKAAWAADVLERKIYPGGLREIADQIGDKHRILERLVEAFRLVRQLERSGHFSPGDTFKKGKGIAKFPFSWVYTALGYQSIREWLGTEEGIGPQTDLQKDPLPQENLDRGAELLVWMFGSRSKGLKPAIDESRQIAELAASVASERKVVLLRRGAPLEQVQEEVKAPHEKIAEGLVTAEEALRKVLGVLGSAQSELKTSNARSLVADSRRVADAAVNVFRTLRDIAEPDYNEQLA